MSKNFIKINIDDKIQFLNIEAVLNIDCYKHEKDYVVKIYLINKDIREYHFVNKDAYNKMINGISNTLCKNEVVE